MDMFTMEIRIVRVDEAVIQVNKDADIQQIAKDVVHESLEGGRRVSKSKKHNTPFERTIAGSEGSFHSSPSQIRFGKMIGMLEINVQKLSSFLGSVNEVGDLGEQIMVFLNDLLRLQKST